MILFREQTTSASLSSRPKFIKYNTKHDQFIDSFKLNYDNIELKRVESIKFLGVVIEKSLGWSQQVSFVKKKLAQVNGVLYKLRKTAPKRMLVSIFNALVQSYISYGISVWGHGGETSKLKDLFVAQKRAIRNIFGVRRINKVQAGHTKSAFTDNNILTVHNLYYKSILVEAYQIKNFTNYPKPLSKHFMFSTVNPSRFCTQHFNYSTLSQHFLFSIPRIWNAISSRKEFRDINFKSLSSFKNFIKKFIVNFQKGGDPENWDR